MWHLWNNLVYNKISSCKCFVHDTLIIEFVALKRIKRVSRNNQRQRKYKFWLKRVFKRILLFFDQFWCFQGNQFMTTKQNIVIVLRVCTFLSATVTTRKNVLANDKKPFCNFIRKSKWTCVFVTKKNSTNFIELVSSFTPKQSEWCIFVELKKLPWCNVILASIRNCFRQ